VLAGAWWLFALSILTKEYAIVFPLAILALPLAGVSTFRQALASSLPYWGMVAGFLSLRFFAFGSLVAGYGDGHLSPRPDLLGSSVWSFLGMLVEPLVANPFLALAVLLAGAALAFAMPPGPSPASPSSPSSPVLSSSTSSASSAGGRIAYWVFWFALFLIPTHNLVFTPRHLYMSFAGLAVGVGLLLSRAAFRYRAPLELGFSALLVALLLPSTFERVASFSSYARMCETALYQLDTVAKTFERGDVVVLAGMPAYSAPPWGFGWSLSDALRPPFLSEPLEDKVTVIARRGWRNQAWARYQQEYPGRRIHVLVWNPESLRLEVPDTLSTDRPLVTKATTVGGVK